MSYKTYKHFREHLGFAVNNWDLLAKNEQLFKAGYWALKSSVEVVLKPGVSNNDKKFIEDALFLFTTEANKRFYKAIYGSGRSEWTFEHDLKVIGSADGAVTGDMYTLLQKYLKPIQQNTGCIISVNIIWDEDIRFVKVSPRAY